MSQSGQLLHVGEHEEVLLTNVRWCSSFFCKLRGLMFRRGLSPGEGLLMVEAVASKVNTSIHMLFMFIPLAVFWLDEDWQVIHKVAARPWRLAYVPSAPAKYVLETDIKIFEDVNIGDTLKFKVRE